MELPETHQVLICQELLRSLCASGYAGSSAEELAARGLMQLAGALSSTAAEHTLSLPGLVTSSCYLTCPEGLLVRFRKNTREMHV